jgi:hypothetical protein
MSGRSAQATVDGFTYLITRQRASDSLCPVHIRAHCHVLPRVVEIFLIILIPLIITVRHVASSPVHVSALLLRLQC